VKKIQTLSLFATLAIAIGMISWGSALHAQDTTPSTPDRQAQQPSTPDTTPPPQTSPSTPDNQQYPTSQKPPAQQPDSSQTPDSSAPSSRAPQSGSQKPSDDSASAGTDTQTFSGTVMKQGDKYMLKDDSGHVYDIDHQDEVKKFDGKRVRVQGTLDPSGNKIMVK
jgi:cytoskeletal protein RodZ